MKVEHTETLLTNKYSSIKRNSVQVFSHLKSIVK